MKIGSVNSVINQYSKIQGKAVQGVPKMMQAMDRVELSLDAKLFSEAFAVARKSMLQEIPGQELQAQQIMEQMRGGNYQIEVQDICDKLLN